MSSPLSSPTVTITFLAISPAVISAMPISRGLDVRVDVRGAELERLVALPLHRLDHENVAGARVHRALQRGHAHPADADDRDVLGRAGCSRRVRTAEP